MPKHARTTRTPARRPARPLTPREVKEGRPDNRPWNERALDSKFLQLEAGGHSLLVVGEPTERVNNFGSQTVDIPTRGGVFSTGAYAILRPLAQYLKAHGRCTGAVLTFTATGEESARRYEGVSIK